MPIEQQGGGLKFSGKALIWINDIQKWYESSPKTLNFTDWSALVIYSYSVGARQKWRSEGEGEKADKLDEWLPTDRDLQVTFLVYQALDYLAENLSDDFRYQHAERAQAYASNFDTYQVGGLHSQNKKQLHPELQIPVVIPKTPRNINWLPILALIGVLCLALGIYTIVKRDTPYSPPSTSTGSQSNAFTIPHNSFAGGQWTEYGPTTDPAWQGHLSHTFMRAAGTITYQINLPEVKGTADVSTQLSSELQKATSTEQKDASDVNLVVNGRPQGTQRVIPDNEVGTTYRWTVPGEAFKAGTNTLTFEVKKGQYANGLSIYSPIQVSIKPTVTSVASKPPNDLSDTYAIAGETVYNKKTMTVFATPQEFMKDSGKTTVQGWIFDRVSQLPPGLRFVDGRPVTPADYQRAK